LTDTALYKYISVKHFGMANIKLKVKENVKVKVTLKQAREAQKRE